MPAPPRERLFAKISKSKEIGTGVAVIEWQFIFFFRFSFFFFLCMFDRYRIAVPDTSKAAADAMAYR